MENNATKLPDGLHVLVKARVGNVSTPESGRVRVFIDGAGSIIVPIEATSQSFDSNFDSGEIPGALLEQARLAYSEETAPHDGIGLHAVNVVVRVVWEALRKDREAWAFASGVSNKQRLEAEETLDRQMNKSCNHCGGIPKQANGRVLDEAAITRAAIAYMAASNMGASVPVTYNILPENAQKNLRGWLRSALEAALDG